MNYINFIFMTLSVIFVYIVGTRIFMEIANFIGELFGFGRLFMRILGKTQRDNQ